MFRISRLVLCSVLFLTFITILTATRSMADTVELNSGKWHLLAVPQAVIAPSLRDLFGAELDFESYLENWVVFTYEDGEYRSPHPDEPLNYGDSLWFRHGEGRAITVSMNTSGTAFMPSRSAQCPSSMGCLSVELRTSGDSVSWQLVGESIGAELSIDELIVVSEPEGTDCYLGCSLREANQFSVVHDRLYSWDSSSQEYATKTPSDKISAFSGFWLATYPQVSDVSLTILIPVKAQQNASLVIDRNASSRAFGTFVTDSGANIMVSGDRDTNGTPTIVREIAYVQSTDTNPDVDAQSPDLVLRYDSGGRLTSVYDRNSGLLKIYYQTPDGDLVVEWVAPGGDEVYARAVDSIHAPSGSVPAISAIGKKGRIELRCGVETGQPDAHLRNASLNLRQLKTVFAGLGRKVPVSVPTEELEPGIFEYSVPVPGNYLSLSEAEKPVLGLLDNYCGTEESDPVVKQFRKLAEKAITDAIEGSSLQKLPKNLFKLATKAPCLGNIAINLVQAFEESSAEGLIELSATATAAKPYSGSKSKSWQINVGDAEIPLQTLVFDDAAACPTLSYDASFTAHAGCDNSSDSYSPTLIALNQRYSSGILHAECVSGSTVANLDYTPTLSGAQFNVDVAKTALPLVEGYFPSHLGAAVSVAMLPVHKVRFDPTIYHPGEFVDIQLKLHHDLMVDGEYTDNQTQFWIARGMTMRSFLYSGQTFNVNVWENKNLIHTLTNTARVYVEQSSNSDLIGSIKSWLNFYIIPVTYHGAVRDNEIKGGVKGVIKYELELPIGVELVP